VARCCFSCGTESSGCWSGVAEAHLRGLRRHIEHRCRWVIVVESVAVVSELPWVTGVNKLQLDMLADDVRGDGCLFESKVVMCWM
jgi:hypothetical protein